MKIRKGFVSNSSSSSFIVNRNNYLIDEEEHFKNEFKQYVKDGIFKYIPKSEFGWAEVQYVSIKEKFDWIVFGVYYYHEFQFECVLKDFLNEMFSECYDYRIIDDDEEGFGYIDHQSVEYKNFEMLESVEKLKHFLFSDSYIQGDNDNH